MQFQNVRVLGVSHVDAPHRIPSSVLEDRLAPALERLGVQSGLLENLSGIVARRWWDEGTQPSTGAALAAEKVLVDSGIDRSRVGVIINTSVCRDYIEPSTACIVHAKLGLDPACLNFDLGNACLGFLNAMNLVATMLERGQIEYGLIVDGESSQYAVESTIARMLRPETDQRAFRAQFATLTLGSGAAAMLLGRAESAPDAPRFTGSVSVSATEFHHLCRGQVDYMETDTKQLLFAGLELADRTWARAQEEFGWQADALDEICMHQVSKVHTELLAQRLGLDLDRAVRLYPEFGNVGPASVIMVLSKALEQGRIRTGHRVGLLGIGSGLNCSMTEIQW
jgi:3-oxoacyl-[acyl-carrier-protein] synthase-3